MSFIFETEKKEYSAWVQVPMQLCPGFELKVIFADVQKGEAFRLKYTERIQTGKKTFQLIENPEKRVEAFKELIYSSVVDWRGIQSQNGSPVEFSRQNLEAVLNHFGNQKVNVMDGVEITSEKSHQNLFDWLSAVITDAENFHGTAENL